MKLKNKLFSTIWIKTVLTVLILFAYSTVYSQDLSKTQMSQIEVDNLTDKQVANYRNKIKKEGYTLDQALTLAKTRGMSELQVQKLRARINNLGAVKQKKNNLPDKVADSKLIFGLTEEGGLKKKAELFGYNFFNNPKISFTPNLNIATPESYVIGVGDVISIDLWGAAEVNYERKVNKQGAINIKGVGYVYLVGLPIKAAKSKIKNYLKRIYSGIGASSKSYNKVNIAISLKEVRNVQLSIVGEVKVPGSYSLNAFSTVLNSLYAAGGPTKNGTFRNIELFRNGTKISDFDVYDFLINGSETGNVSVKDQDVIIVKPYESIITIKGAVKRPGMYELKKTESITDLLKYCGGFTSEAYKQVVVIERINGKQKQIVEVPFEKFNSEKLKDGDFISINKITNQFLNRVSITGAVFQPGVYELKEELSVADLLEKAEGITQEAFLDRAIITRTFDKVTKETISFSLKNNNDDIFLKENDVIHVFSKEELKEKEFISITGAVNNGGRFDYSKGMHIEDLIALGGGLQDGADVANIDVSRRLKDGSLETISQDFDLTSTLNLETSSSNTFILQPFDIVSVRYIKGYTAQKTVFVKGEVNYKGKYSLSTKNERISDLIIKSGGITKYAYIEGAFLTRKNNTLEDKKQLQQLVNLDEINVSKATLKKGTFKIGIDLKRILAERGKGSKYDLILEEGDELFIPSERQTVKVEGEVLSPSLIRYEKRKGFKYYIENSGGFSSKARKAGAYVVYANGDIKTTKRFLFFKSYPDVKPGSVILVPNKPESRKKVSAQELIAVTTGLATLGILVKSLTDKSN